MGEDVEFVIENGCEYEFGNLFGLQQFAEFGVECSVFDLFGDCRCAGFLRSAEDVGAVASRVVDVGVDTAGAEHGDTDSVFGKFDGQGLADPDHRVFRRAVDTDIGDCRQAADRGCVDDVTAFALFAHSRNEGANAVHYAHHVDAEQPVPVVVRRVDERAIGDHPGVVAEQMDCAESVPGGSGERVNGFPIADVTADANGFTAALANRFRRAFGVGRFDVSEYDLHSSSAGRSRESLANAPGSSCDYCDAPLEIVHLNSLAAAFSRNSPLRISRVELIAKPRVRG